MALGRIVTPPSNFSWNFELPRRKHSWLHTSSLGSLVSHRVQSPSTYHLPPQPRPPRVPVRASSSRKQQGLVHEQGKEATNASPDKLSSILVDILKQRSESGLSNDVVELEDEDAGFDWGDDSDGDSFVRRLRDTQSNQEDRSSSTDPKSEDRLWSAEERSDSEAWNLDEGLGLGRVGGDEGLGFGRVGRGGPKLKHISKSYPSIPAKFSKYTRRKRANRGSQSRSGMVRQEQKESNVQLQPYYNAKSVFFQDFVPNVITPEQPCQFSYSEHPKIPPIGFREPVYSPFGPEDMVRPWTGKRPQEPTKRAPREFDSFKLPPAAMTKVKRVASPGPFPEGTTGPHLGRTRAEILGKPLSKDEVAELVAEACVERRRLDLGKDGLTHNMLDLLHRHWKRRRICRIKCYGVPTVDMDNLCSVIEEKSGGKIVRRSKSMLYVFRGRNYNWNTRPSIPLMLWKPPAPIYPPVVQSVPQGLSVEEADNLRASGRRIHCLCRLQRAGMYQNLVKMVKDTFEIDELVKVDCRELERSDMKKIGAKLRDLVPCVPISFERHFMLLWRGSKSNNGESQSRDEEDTSSATTAPYEIIISEDGEEAWQGDDGSEVHNLTKNCSNQKDEYVKDIVETDAEEIGHQFRDFTHHGVRSDLKSEDNILQEQEIYANVSETTADLASERVQLTSDNEGQSMDATAVMATEEAVLEFDRLWQEAINSEEVVVLDNKSEADSDSVLEKVKSQSSENQDLDSTLSSWEDGKTKEDEPSETDEDQSTLRMWKQRKLSSRREYVDEYEEDGEQQEEIISNTTEQDLLLPPTLTDITIPQEELKRLCALRLTIRGWMTIGTEGVSRGIVKSIHSKWLVSEIAKVRYIVPGCNMRKLHDDLERLTGGLVIWMEGPAVVIYRGKDYLPGWVRKFKERQEAYRERLQSLGLDEEDEREQLIKEGTKTFSTSQMGKTEMEELLDDLGTQCTEWTEGGHVPVDGDLLLPPNSVFMSPFRRLPYGVRPRLTNFEMTEMRHLAKKLPPHFVLGKRRGLEGLASAIVKLWEKSEIVKVAMKRGVSRIDNDRMAAELRRLTGGDLIARNMTYIVLFRGNDFLPHLVKRTLEEKNRMVTTLLEEEERVRLAGICNGTQIAGAPLKPRNAGTLAESLEEKARWDPWQASKDCSTQTILVRKAARDQALQRMQRLLNSVAHKIDRAERELNNLDVKVRPKRLQVAKEQVSEEEMYTLRKIGLRMKPFLLLGRREVFGGIIENMHLNWKWRELVKIIVKKSYFMYREKDAVEEIARMLEIESGGIVVGMCSIPVGEAIIVYRGKNYHRPTDGISPQGHPNGLRPRGLLTKREAWQRFNQKRRKLSLKKHLHKLERDFSILQADMKRMEEEDVNLDNEEGNPESSTTQIVRTG